MGRFQGACVYFEQILQRDLLCLPCRHHIYELILSGAFDEKISQSSGPTISIFKKFQESWPKISKQKFIPGIKDEYVRQPIQDTNEVLEFAMQTLQKVKHPREDYREFVELVIIFLGGTPPRGISFSGPGAFRHARWMAKAIYFLKILSPVEELLQPLEIESKL